MRFKKGERVQAIKSGYGPGSGKLIKGIVLAGSYGPDNYVKIGWDNGDEDFGFVRHFKRLRKVKVRHRRRMGRK
jgi:hypothetical protein